MADDEKMIPANERWIYDPSTAKIINQAIAWAEKYAPKASSLERLERRIAKPR